MSKSPQNIEIICSPADSGRLDLFLSERLPTLSRSRIAGLIKQEAILVNELPSKPGYSIHLQDRISVKLPQQVLDNLEAEEMSLDILFEDEFYVAINKPAGLVVHPGAGNFQGTLVSGLMHYSSRLSRLGGNLRPGLVHRLDKDTSGVVVAARTDEAHWKLARLFECREIYKEYLAIVWGVPQNSIGIIDAAIGRSPRNRQKFTVIPTGRTARTRYQVLQDFKIAAELQLVLETGRTHQARVHLVSMGHAIIGDYLYGGGLKYLQGLSRESRNLGKQILGIANRQMLHARLLKFIHPFTRKEVCIQAALPADFKQVETILQKAKYK
jgi:23S rRNA pseudouridine1911/1915/1917 synthase